MYIATSDTKVYKNISVNADIRFSSTKSDSKTSQHTYKALPSFNTDI